MKPRFALLAAFLCFASIIATSTKADQLYNNLTPNSSIGLASQTDMSPGGEVEAADDFIFTTPTTINSASFTGLISAGTFGVPTIAGVTIEIYRVFPFDSDTNRTPNVVTRANSPSDVAFASRTSSSPGDLTFSTATQASSFTTLNSVQVGGINPKPNQTTGGNGPVTGQEVQFDVTFTKPFDLPADHYFLVGPSGPDKWRELLLAVRIAADQRSRNHTFCSGSAGLDSRRKSGSRLVASGNGHRRRNDPTHVQSGVLTGRESGQRSGAGKQRLGSGGNGVRCGFQKAHDESLTSEKRRTRFSQLKKNINDLGDQVSEVVFFLRERIKHIL